MNPLVFVWILVSSVVSSLLEAWCLHRLWAWFVAAEYGPGPYSARGTASRRS